uniref:Chromosomal replication initiator protein DnaA n=1 Tax=uncultured Acidobacteria bacterium A2 TaxID=1036852 RepID=F8TTG3_9BACT|nr:chromosome replication initiation protein [uncultured Acidobacteria bacterium A2]
MRVRFAIDPELFQAAREQQNSESVPASEETPARVASTETPALARRANGAAPRDPEETPLPPRRRAGARQRRWHRLGDFVVGACNRLAYASAQAVVEEPGHSVNPLVLHGPVGVGKTHLLEGIHAALRKEHHDWNLVFLSAEEFTHRFVSAMRLGKLSSFRKQFRDADALFVDDVNFLAGKRATQEEFLHTFDYLHAHGRQLAFTCDCHPKLADDYFPELSDRLLGGAVWSLLPADEPTRLAILRSKAGKCNALVPEDVLALLAVQLRGNVRELEGALHSVRHYSLVTGRPIDLVLAREALADLLRHSVRVLQLPDVDRAVCKALRLEVGALKKKQRSWAVSHPRMLAMYLSRKHTAAAFSEIVQYFGGQNHSTAVAADKKVRQWLESDRELALGPRQWRTRELIELIERELSR